MGIYGRQYEKTLTREMLRIMMLGRMPATEELAAQIKAKLGNGGITYQFHPQADRSIFLHEIYNDSMRRIYFDLETLQEEVLDLFGGVTKRFQFADLYHKVHSYELDQLKSKLEALLFSIDNADFYFVGAFDNFSDASKTDYDHSTEGVVNLDEHCLALPYGGKSTQRIPMPHLLTQASWPVEILQPGTANVLTRAQRSDFSNMFQDQLAPWLYEVSTNVQAPVEIRLRFPLAGLAQDEVEVFVSRIEMIPHAVTKQLVTVRVSTDDVNYKTLLGYEGGVTLSDQRTTTGMDFETNLVQFIELTFRKENPDTALGQEDGNKVYTYLFGLKRFAAFTTGRLEEARYQSKPFDFSADGTVIGMVGIKTDTRTVPGTSVRYSVALADSAGTPLGNFLPIADGAPVKLGNILQNTARFEEARTLAYSTPFQGKQLYQIGNPILPKPIFGSAVLRRGYRSWYRDTAGSYTVEDVSDNYVSFSGGDLQSLYALVTELPTFQIIPGTGNRGMQLTVSNTILYSRERGHLLTPNPDEQTAGVDLTPNYAIYKVRQIGQSSSATLSVTFATRTFELPVSNFLLSGPTPADTPTLANGTTQLISGVDFNFEVEGTGALQKPTGRVTIPDGSSLLNATGGLAQATYTLLFSFTYDQDITHKVTRIDGRAVSLGNVVYRPGDYFEIRYRYLPVAPSEIIKASIQVKSAPSSSSQVIRYREGQDYVVDPRTAAIQRLPNGRIDAGAVFVDFQYRYAETGIETFTVWAYLRAVSQIRLDLDNDTKQNKLVADEDKGERFLLNSPQGLIDLTKSTATPTLQPGWVQFLVRSKNPDTNPNYRTNLIDQVIQLRDLAKKKVFLENGTYFDELLAFRDPLTQVTLNSLRVNTLPRDRTVFAIDDFTDPQSPTLVVPYPPNQAGDLYLRVPTPETQSDGRPQEAYEAYRVDWGSQLSTGQTGSKLIVRADLRRDPSVDGALTPKVFSYTLRASL